MMMMGWDGQATLVQVLIDEYYGFSFSRRDKSRSCLVNLEPLYMILGVSDEAAIFGESQCRISKNRAGCSSVLSMKQLSFSYIICLLVLSACEQ